MENNKEEEQKTILLVDDTKANLDIVLAILQDYDMIPVMSGQDALSVLADEKVDMVLLDILMPEMDGFEVCRRMKADQELKDIPVIFITAKSDEASIEKAYEVGGIDYVTKPFKPRELQARVKTHLEMKELIERLHFIASRDSLTGIYNRRKFFELSETLFSESGENLYAAMLDIDFFKRINDTYGHQMGDITLKTITGIIAAQLPKDAIFGRMGGEEFALVFKAPSQDDAKILITKIIEAVPGIDISTPENVKISCTISSGFAANHTGVDTLDSLLREADEALYQAKSTGRNRSIFRG